MKKEDFISLVISTLEDLMLEELGDCYDVTSEVHDLVNSMTSNNDIEWEQV